MKKKLFNTNVSNRKVSVETYNKVAPAMDMIDRKLLVSAEEDKTVDVLLGVHKSIGDIIASQEEMMNSGNEVTKEFVSMTNNAVMALCSPFIKESECMAISTEAIVASPKVALSISIEDNRGFWRTIGDALTKTFDEDFVAITKYSKEVDKTVNKAREYYRIINDSMAADTTEEYELSADIFREKIPGALGTVLNNKVSLDSVKKGYAELTRASIDKDILFKITELGFITRGKMLTELINGRESFTGKEIKDFTKDYISLLSKVVGNVYGVFRDDYYTITTYGENAISNINKLGNNDLLDFDATVTVLSSILVNVSDEIINLNKVKLATKKISRKELLEIIDYGMSKLSEAEDLGNNAIKSVRVLKKTIEKILNNFDKKDEAAYTGITALSKNLKGTIRNGMLIDMESNLWAIDMTYTICWLVLGKPVN